MSNFDIDPDTGMPILPEGQFWRVQQDYEHSTSGWSGRVHTLQADTRVSLMERRENVKIIVRWGLFRDEERTMEDVEIRYDTTGGLNPDTGRIQQTALKILRQLEWQKEREEKNRVERENREKLYGDYPPKNLNEVL